MTNPSHGKSPQYYQFARPEVQALVPENARRILDVGCGQGALGAALKERQQCEVWGVEYIAEVAADAADLLDRVVTGSLEEPARLTSCAPAGPPKIAKKPLDSLCFGAFWGRN